MRESLAYQTMFRFLEERYFRLRSDELGALLGELSLLSDGRPRDTAIAAEWDKAVEQVAGKNQLNDDKPRPQRRAG